jgi:putative membrane protein
MAVKKEIDERAAALARYAFTAPSWKRSLALSIVFAALAGAGASDAMTGLLLIALPAVLSTFLTPLAVRAFDKSFTLNRSALLSLAGTVILGLTLGIGAIAAKILHRSEILAAYIMGIGIIFAFRLLILITISSKELAKVIFPASIQTLISIPLLWLYFKELQSSILLLALYCIIFTLAAFLYTKFMDRPLRKLFGISGLDFVRCFISRTEEGSEELERIFQKLGEPVNIPVSILSFKHSEGKLKAMFVIPMVHPGPMKDIGGGALPLLISKSFNFAVFVPHGTAYHDFNLVSKREINKIIEVVKKALFKMDYSALATRSIRVIEGDVKILAQRFGDSALFISTLSPKSTEDIEFGVGLAALTSVKMAGAKNAAIIDAHNCTEPYARIIMPGSKASYDLIKAVTRAWMHLAQGELGKIRIGVARHPPICRREEGMGDLGILLAVVEVLNQRTAYILIDGNNMVKGLRDKIVEEVKALGIDEVEVMTTDTHIVNINSGAIFIGTYLDHAKLINAIKQLVSAALQDLEEVEAGLNSEIAEDIYIFGAHKTAQLATAASTIIAMGGAFAASVIIAAISLSLIAFLLASAP